MAKVGPTSKSIKPGAARVDINVSGAVDALSQLSKSVLQASEDLQIELAEEGAKKMQELIETRGTVRKWNEPMYAKEHPNKEGNLRDASFPGRVNTGTMRDAVGTRIERGAKRISAVFGWTGKVEPYFYAQEYGTDAMGFRKPSSLAGLDSIRGMFALRDARLYAVTAVLPKLARKYANRIARGKY